MACRVTPSNNKCVNSYSSSPSYRTITAKLDSGASKTYVRPANTACLHHIADVLRSLVGLPNKATSSITKAGTLALSDKLSPSAKTGHILNDLSSATLLSAGQLCDDDCIITLDKHTAHITKQGHTILTGKRNSSDGLWDIKLPILDLPQPRMHACNAIIRKDTNKKFLADYIYKSCFSPPLSTLLKAINNNHFLGWPGIDDTSIKRLLSETMATAKGHLDQEQQHLQTTKHTTHDDDAFPPTMPPTIKAYNTFTLLKNTQPRLT